MTRAWLTSWLALLALTIGLSIVASGDGVLPGDVRVARFVQRTPDTPGQLIADLGNLLGSTTVCVMIVMLSFVGMVLKRRLPEAALILAALLVRPTNGLLKALFDSPRPSPDFVRVTEIAGGLGFPSGHAMGSTLCWGSFVLVLHRLSAPERTRAILVLDIVLVLLAVGFGRIYVGAHWPSDVLGGYLWGTLLLTAIYAAVQAIWPIGGRSALPSPVY